MSDERDTTVDGVDEDERQSDVGQAQSTENFRDTLRFECVEYLGQPDYCTIYPSDLPDDKRMESWLSADRTAFVTLDEWR